MNREAAIIEVIRSALAAAESLPPASADRIYGALLATLRSRRPDSASPLGTLPPPGTPIVDPRRQP